MSVLVFLALCVPAGAQIVRWTDERGEVHMGDLESVPERYRGNVETLSTGGPTAPGGGPADPSPGRVTSVASGRATIRFEPGKRIMAVARINGGAIVSLMIDTGADTTTIKTSVMRALGVDLRTAPTRPIAGIAGVSPARRVTLDQLDVQGATVGPLEVNVMDLTSLPGQGLIGRDFLRHFEVQMDHRAGILTLRAR